MGKLLILPTTTTLPIPVERVIDAAHENCEKCLVIGIDKEGMPYYAASFADKREILWMVEKFKKQLLDEQL